MLSSVPQRSPRTASKRASVESDNIHHLGRLQVLLHVTHSNLKAKIFEIRLDKHMTVERVKEKLRTHTGTGSAHMYCPATLSDARGCCYLTPLSCSSVAVALSPPPRHPAAIDFYLVRNLTIALTARCERDM